MASGRLPGLNKLVSRVILGTATNPHVRLSPAFLDSIFEMGCNAFDTARIYGDAEKRLGAWIRDRGVQSGTVVITKGGHPSREKRSRLNRTDLISDVERSLDALGLDTLDVFLLHRDDRGTPIEDILGSLNELNSRGMIQLFGVSNWDTQRIADAQAIAARIGLRGFSMSSPHFSLAEWNHEPWPGCVTLTGKSKQDERRWYIENQLPVLAWSSLAAGFFSDKLQKQDFSSSSTSSRSETICEEVYRSAANEERLRRAETLAKRRGLQLTQIALAYVLCQPMNIYAALSTSDFRHFKSNLEALSIFLSSAESQWLNLETDDMPLAN
jgi:1-deoxyxylulose-5-phosphate synthase